jgi:hypothetical protein
MSSSMSDRTCSKCCAEFQFPALLKRHLARKTPCALIIDPAELPEDKKESAHKCKFCGRAFASRVSLLRHIRQTCKVAPREGSTEGMDKLYEHTLKKMQMRMDAQQKEIESLKASSAAATAAMTAATTAITTAATTTVAAAPQTVTNNTTVTNIVDRSVGKTTINNVVNVSIGFFGHEKLDRITKPQVFDILRGLGPVGENVKTVAEKAIIQAAMLIFSDPTHPEDITCYLPNKKGENALVHGETGWEVQPVGLVISPMAAQSIETLFLHQPAPDRDTPEKDVKWIMEECGNIMRYIQKHEGDLTNEPPRGEMRGILIRNKDLLQQVLKKLPVAGQK